MLTTWQVWILLGVMLALGGLVEVGIKLKQFSLAALLTALGAVAGVELESQVDMFLACSFVLVAVSFFGRSRHQKEVLPVKRTID